MHEIETAMQRACAVVTGGGVLVYPTETLYAIGCSGLDEAAAARVFALKNRDHSKPLPLIIAETEQLSLITNWMPDDLFELGQRFWPGPLSVLVPTLPGLPPQIQDRRGLTSVRVTPHPVAAELARRTGVPLVATSANISGKSAVARPSALDPALTAGVDDVLDVEPWPRGGDPSTVVGIERPGELTIYREGAISRAELEAAGFAVCQPAA